MLSTQPYKGARDFFPENIQLRNYIFDTWRRVCKLYGFEEYDGPFLEPVEIYTAKSGNEIVNEELYHFTDRGGRQIAVRPEMTPTVSRMAAEKIRQQTQLPLKWFSIANFWRYQKPQKGRGREFYQLNVDIFGEPGVEADLEILLLNKAIMEAFGATDSMYKILVNNRYLINFLFEDFIGLTKEQAQGTARAMDKSEKITSEEYEELLKAQGLTMEQVQKVKDVSKYTWEELEGLDNLPNNAKQLVELLRLASEFGIKNVVYSPTLVRGFDYYDGNIFEQFDMTPGNNRSMFGGGRYDGLIGFFIDKQIPATGYAPGDMTLIEFLESWNLIPEFTNETRILVTIFPNDSQCFTESVKIAQELRAITNVEMYVNTQTDLAKQIKYADKKNIEYVVIVGPDELKEKSMKVKNLKTGEQKVTTDSKDIVKFIYG